MTELINIKLNIFQIKWQPAHSYIRAVTTGMVKLCLNKNKNVSSKNPIHETCNILQITFICIPVFFFTLLKILNSDNINKVWKIVNWHEFDKQNFCNPYDHFNLVSENSFIHTSQKFSFCRTMAIIIIKM